MAIPVLGRRPHRPGDRRVREILDRAPARIDSTFISEFDRPDAVLFSSYGVRMPVLAMREHSLDRLHDGLLARALGAAVDTSDDRELMIDLALPHVAAAQLAAGPEQVFQAAAARFEDGWLVELLREFGARADVTMAAFGWRQIAAPDGLDVIFSRPR